MQHDAIVRLSAIESVALEDGSISETHRLPGHVALDAPAIVAGALEVSQVHAERRVRAAVRIAADGAPGTTTCTGLGGLHDAMRSGSLDAYRAGVVADELEEAPPEVAEAVVTSLGEHLARETAPQLRRRCRRLLARISPDLLRQRAKRAREECGLRRWVDEPGVDRWEGSFPSEDAARAWAAIDARAQQLVTDGTCGRVDRARAQALIDLVTASATITTVVTLTVPADVRSDGSATPLTTSTAAPPCHQPTASTSATATAAPPTPAPTASTRAPADIARRAVRSGEATRTADLVEVPHPLGGEPMLVSRDWLVALTGSAGTTVRQASCHAITGGLLGGAGSDAYRPSASLVRLVKQRDGRCRFPGCSVAARFCDLDHVRPWPLGPTSGANLVCLCRRHHRVKQRPRWRCVLSPDGTVTWTDPAGHVRTTLPVDALHCVVLNGVVVPAEGTAPDGGAVPPLGPGAASTGADAPHSGLEFALEHLLGSSLMTRRRTVGPGRRVDLDLTAGYEVRGERRTGCRRPRPARRTSRDPDDPPF